MGDDYLNARRYLRSTLRHAHAVPSLHPGGCGPAWEVIQHAPEDWIAVCPQTREVRSLCLNDVVVWELDLDAIYAALRRALDLSGPMGPLSPAGTHQAGLYRPHSGGEIPVLAALSCSGRAAKEALTGQLCLKRKEPFVVLFSLRDAIPASVHEHLTAHRGCGLGLDELFFWSAKGELVGASNARQLLPGNDPAEAEMHVFRRVGDSWELRFKGVSVSIRHGVGMTYLAELLAHPHEHLSAARLAALGQPTDRLAASGSSGAALDEVAKCQYKDAIRNLEEELADARQRHDSTGQERIEREMEELKVQIKKDLRMGGKSRESSDAERHRKAVSKAIHDARTKIHKSHNHLYRHLLNYVSTGQTCSYGPPKDLHWVTH
ncbi:MAG: hypothetical protein AMXMBFR7_52930 [Planctomycetota bacterium]